MKKYFYRNFITYPKILKFKKLQNDLNHFKKI